MQDILVYYIFDVDAPIGKRISWSEEVSRDRGGTGVVKSGDSITRLR